VAEVAEEEGVLGLGPGLGEGAGEGGGCGGHVLTVARARGGHQGVRVNEGISWIYG
jgi:hypothetical protein